MPECLTTSYPLSLFFFFFFLKLDSVGLGNRVQSLHVGNLLALSTFPYATLVTSSTVGLSLQSFGNSIAGVGVGNPPVFVLFAGLIDPFVVGSA